MSRLETRLAEIIKRKSQLEHEIERRFLVDALPFRTGEYPNVRSGYPHAALLQYYIKMGDCSFRLRITGNKSILSTKRGEGLLRQEEKWAISERESRELVALVRESNLPGLRKTRFYLPYNGGEIELDLFRVSLKGSSVRFDLNGFAIAEVEFKTLEEQWKFGVPSWFGTEITWKRNYGNGAIAKNGIPEGVKLLSRR